ncbi:MAG: transposase [Halofilum sp. (in: g-proteobacteria)]|nr:transposase [Halofilum sp. (in: g-proteobacteria)]
MGKRTYRATDFHRVDWTDLARRVEGGRAVFAIDAAKKDFVGVLMDGDREGVKTVKWRHPRDTRALVEELARLSADLEVVLEPTGTYADAVVYQLRRAGLAVYRMPPKRVHDAREIYDGVPSMHDGKSAYVIARLQLEGVGARWAERGELRRSLDAESNQLDFCRDELQRAHNRLEAQLARHWPEAEELMSLDATSLLRLLADYGSPAAVAADAEGARTLLADTGGRFLQEEKIEALIDSARTTIGVPCLAAEAGVIRELAEQLLALKAQRRRLERALHAASEQDEGIGAQREVVGAVTAAILFAALGDARDYPDAASYAKAAGLNLREDSSGEYQGPLRLTKRGPGVVRLYLYFAVLRWIARAGPARRWYEAKVARDGGVTTKAIAALMRKLVRALWHVGQGECFDETRLFADACA